jgi:acetyl-CoA C-acetyltransferase
LFGGMENMSLAPHYMHLRTGTKFGPTSMVDGLQKMGLLMLMTTMQWVCADLCAAEYKFTRERR